MIIAVDFNLLRVDRALKNKMNPRRCPGRARGPKDKGCGHRAHGTPTAATLAYDRGRSFIASTARHRIDPDTNNKEDPTPTLQLHEANTPLSTEIGRRATSQPLLFSSPLPRFRAAARRRRAAGIASSGDQDGSQFAYVSQGAG